MKAQKETKWVCIQLACSRRPRALEEAHYWNIQAKFYNEDHGATLKHKCGKRIVALSLLFLFFIWPLFLFGLSLFFSFFLWPLFFSFLAFLFFHGTMLY